MRKVPEWIADHDDQAIPRRVKLRIWAREDGKCHLTGRKITPGDEYDFDHIIALSLGGEHREGNIALALKGAHKEKTASDRADKTRTDRLKAKYAGLKPKTGFQTNRSGKWKKKLDGTVERRDK